MHSYHSRAATWVIVFLAMASLGNYRLAAQETPPATPAEEQPEVLSRGPVHEAFAEPVPMELQSGLVVPEPPPPSIEELPPSEKPQGQQFVWIPGYWAWDADRSGYIWVSACWRVPPPKMSWVPGYWAQVTGGWQWIAGFWTPANIRDIQYLPAPPTVGDIEPVGSPPSADMIWVPPCMYWSQGLYVRRAGYWLDAQPNWVWVPSHYVSTPRGYIFAEGHWDYALERRGVLFAPVYFPASVYGRVGFTYCPAIVIDLGLLQGSLFAYPFYSHYYFGDYYDDFYLRIGIYPWFDCWRYRTWYDPIYTHARWRNRSVPRWEEHERDQYRRRHDDQTLRPARTFREQESRLAQLPETQRHALRTVQPLETAHTSRKTPMKYERIDTDTRHKISKEATDVQTFRNERNHWEAPASDPKKVRPPREQKSNIAPPTEHRQTTRPPDEHRSNVTPPTEHRKTTRPPDEHRSTVTPPRERQQKPEVIPPREIRQPQPERIEIPASPVAGQSGRQGFFQKGPPTQPAEEDRGKKDSHRK